MEFKLNINILQKSLQTIKLFLQSQKLILRNSDKIIFDFISNNQNKFINHIF